MLLAARITMYTIHPPQASSSTVDVESFEDVDGAVGESVKDLFSREIVTFTNFAPATGGIAFTGLKDLNNVIAAVESTGSPARTSNLTCLPCLTARSVITDSPSQR